ncbi:hypothetical protein V1511DRAFT_447975, partial [Dipodascopsis uninucleata]
ASLSYDASRPNAMASSRRFQLHAWDQASVAAFERCLGPSNDMTRWAYLPTIDQMEKTLDEISGIEPVHLVLELLERQVARTSILMSVNAQLQRDLFDMQCQLQRQTSIFTPTALPVQLYGPPSSEIRGSWLTPTTDVMQVNGTIGDTTVPFQGYPPKAPFSAYQNGYASYYSQFRTQPYTPY